ncbi:MAG: hypothetical protein JWP30_1030 [Homoserinimonas sp.]|jgi:hypothetical protein|nr:hypothetical protein [Homoserinimonas sp.]
MSDVSQTGGSTPSGTLGEGTERSDAPDGALSPGSTATGNPSSGDSAYEKGSGIPADSDSSTGSLDGGWPGAEPEALVEGGRVATAEDME